MKRVKHIHILFPICCFFWLTSSLAQKTENLQSLETGLPYIKNYTPRDYNANARNFGAVQDSLGIMYFANGNGILMYDGSKWEVVELPEQNWVLSIAIDHNNRVYVGGSGEFGYLEADEFGEIKYFSLSDLLDKSQSEFTWIWAIHPTKEAIYFREKNNLFIWEDNQFKVWKSSNVLDTSFLVGSNLYVNVRGVGLTIWNGNELTLVGNGEFFAEKRIGAILPLEENSLLIGTLEEFFVYENGGVRSFETDLDEFIKQYKLYSCIRLGNGNIAVATANGGLGVIDENGRKQLLVNKEGALASLAMNSLYQDKDGLIWASLEYGISKIEYPSAFSNYSQLGITSTCFIIGRFQGDLYVGTENGLFRLVNSQSEGAHFENVMNIKDGIKNLVAFDNNLLLATDSGLYNFSEEQITQIGSWYPLQLRRSAVDPNRVFVSLSDGLGSVYLQDGNWQLEGLFQGVRGTIGKVVEDKSGALWLSGSGNRVYRIVFQNMVDAKGLKKPEIEQFGPEQGLPDDRGSFYKVNNTIYFTSKTGKTSYEYDKESNQFKPDSTLNRALALSGTKKFIQDVDIHGNVLVVEDNVNHPDKFFVAWNSGEGKFVLQDLKEERIVTDIGYSFFTEPADRVVWHGGASGLLRHDLKLDFLSKVPYRTLVRKVQYMSDSLLAHSPYSTKKFKIPFRNNNFRFQYTSSNYIREDSNAYQYILDDFDENWSDWSRETQKDYTNIPEGHYTFRVRAKNILGQVGKEGTYSFTILPPWYRTWWAYLGYALMGALLIWAFSQWRSKQLRNKNLALEAVVAERTSEIREKNKKLGYQAERLKELDTMKTRLFANISHEFRTPLTLIKGPVEKLEEEKKTNISMTNVKMIRRNANRLLILVNQLLDLSKLDSDKLRLNEGEGDVLKCIRAAASAFGSHAASRNMDYQIKIPSRRLWASFDRDKLEKIVYNLLSNAFKFTEDEGRVTIETEFRGDRLRLKVSDTGSGMSREKLPHIFDRFFQVDDSYTREKAGSGIGLALTKELAELMGGTIYVESELGKGSMFRVVLPLEEIHPGEIPQEVDDMSAPVFEDESEELVELAKANKDVNILIIEDNNDMRHFVREQLEADYGISEARNGREGLEMANKQVPDLIITDLMMPQMDGVTLCKKLKTEINTSHIPVIMLTAKAGIENKLEGLETGADDYLTKPFNARELQIRVKNLIEQRARLRALYSGTISLDPKEIAVTSVDEAFLEEVLTLLEENYGNPEFGPRQLHRQLAMSKTQLHRKLRALTDTPPSELLRNFRLKRAAQLLPRRRDNISQVAYDVGFNSLSYFTKCFKDLYGMSPTEYIQKNNAK